MKKKKPKTHVLELHFDSKDAAHGFVAHWLDGGGDGGGNLDWSTTKWNSKYTYMRIKGTGYPICEDGTVLTPDVEQQRLEEDMKKFRSNK